MVHLPTDECETFTAQLRGAASQQTPNAFMHYARDRNSAVVADPIDLFPPEQRGGLRHGSLSASPATTDGQNEETRGMVKFIKATVRAVFVAPSP
jgi:hypothetical protein